jgi:hypothetical protein
MLLQDKNKLIACCIESIKLKEKEKRKERYM